jgi:flavodoxin
MRIALVYGSTHGKTAKVVADVHGQLNAAADVFNASDVTCPASLCNYDLLLFFCPTYGDEELQQDMEQLLLTFSVDLGGRYFAVCELGSYYGYDDFSFGAMRMIRRHLLNLNAQELCEPLSLDSFPRMSREHLLDWVDYLNGKIYERFGLCYS